MARLQVTENFQLEREMMENKCLLPLFGLTVVLISTSVTGHNELESMNTIERLALMIAATQELRAETMAGKDKCKHGLTVTLIQLRICAVCIYDIV